MTSYLPNLFCIAAVLANVSSCENQVSVVTVPATNTTSRFTLVTTIHNNSMQTVHVRDNQTECEWLLLWWSGQTLILNNTNKM